MSIFVNNFFIARLYTRKLDNIFALHFMDLQMIHFALKAGGSIIKYNEKGRKGPQG